jgi:tetratricopeptide (TPR) repeat protein
MATVSIRELARLADGRFSVALGFDDGVELETVVEDPFAARDEQLLEWYFDQHHSLPLLRQVEAERAAGSISAYGEALFAQLTAAPGALDRLRAAATLATAPVWQVIGSPLFHRLHWEALKDPSRSRPFVLEGPMVRRGPEGALGELACEGDKLRLLLVVARPLGRNDVGARTISRPLVEELRGATGWVEIDILRPGTYEALERHLEEVLQDHGAGYYQVVHFDTHGGLMSHNLVQRWARDGGLRANGRSGRDDLSAYEGRRAFLLLEDGVDPRLADPVEAGELAHLLSRYGIPAVIVNACQSGRPVGERQGTLGSHLLEAGIPVVLVMAFKVMVMAAQLLMRRLYRQLFAGQDLAEAIRAGRCELFGTKARRGYFNTPFALEDWLLPVVYQGREVRFRFHGQHPEGGERGDGRRFPEPATVYGFFGRDLDVLAVEREVVRHNFLLVRGMGGAGKTTFLRHLGAWWQETGFVEQVLPFGFDERAWTVLQIVEMAAGRLATQVELRELRSLGLAGQAAWLTGRLRARRHLLILDNLESITGSALALRNVLQKAEQDELRSFLTGLVGGRTLVLLGSRSGEEWLAPETFGEHVHSLPGLDPEAASILADQVLERSGAQRYRGDESLSLLLHRLAGFPLAIQVVFRNLAQRAPREVLEALEAGKVDLDTRTPGDRTESILRCIEYSYDNLSADARTLLACLAPFTGVIEWRNLPYYVEQLQREPELSTLPFGGFGEALAEAESWGLLASDEEGGFFVVQPTLPFFLRGRLAGEDRQALRRAIDRAFVELYDGFGAKLASMFHSGEPAEIVKAQTLTEREYDNLHHALGLALKAERSVLRQFLPLSAYLDRRHDHGRAEELGRAVLASLTSDGDQKSGDEAALERVTVLDDLANRSLSRRRFPEAREAYERVLAEVRRLGGLTQELRGSLEASALHQLGVVEQLTGHEERAESLYREARRIALAVGDRDRLLQETFQLGRIAEDRSQWAVAEELYREALTICGEIGERRFPSKIHHQLGILAEEQGQWEAAARSHEEALRIDREFEDRLSQGRALHHLGVVYQHGRQWEQAHGSYEESLKIWIELGDLHRQGAVYHNLGVLAFERREWEQAERYFQEALRIGVETGDRGYQGGVHHQLGILARERRRWDEARASLIQAFDIAGELSQRVDRAAALHELGRLEHDLGSWAAAEANYREALQIFLDLDRRESSAGTSHQLGLVLQQQGRWAEARRYLLEALAGFIACSSPEDAWTAFKSLALLSPASGDRSLSSAVADLLDMTSEEVEAKFQEIVAFNAPARGSSPPR